MTIEKLQFSLPAVFTIGPDDKKESLEKYAVLLTGGPDGSGAMTGGKVTATGRNHVQDIVKGIIEGETRVIVSGMSMEEIFKERQIFKQKVIQNVQSELDQFGLRMSVITSFCLRPRKFTDVYLATMPTSRSFRILLEASTLPT
jgi:flotillin